MGEKILELLEIFFFYVNYQYRVAKTYRMPKLKINIGLFCGK